MVFTMDSASIVEENVGFCDFIQDENFVDISHHFLSDIFASKSEQEITYHDNYVKNSDSDIDDYESDRVYTLADKKNFHYKCAKCDLEFTDEKAVIDHVDSHEKTLQKYRCDDCSKEYLTKDSLKMHRISEHRKKFVCHRCDRILSSLANLKAHLSKHDNNKDSSRPRHGNDKKLKVTLKLRQQQKSFACPYCNKLLSSKVNLDSHLTIHTGEKKFKCDVCDKRFTTKSGLQCHESIHKDDKPFHCSQCDKSFNTKQGFRYHNNLHVKAQAVGSNHALRCPICDKCYVSLKSFQRHSKTHSKLPADDDQALVRTPD